MVPCSSVSMIVRASTPWASSSDAHVCRRIVHSHSSHLGIPAQDGQHPIQTARVCDPSMCGGEDQPGRLSGPRLPLPARDLPLLLLLCVVLAECPRTSLRQGDRPDRTRCLGRAEDEFPPDALHVPPHAHAHGPRPRSMSAHVSPRASPRRRQTVGLGGLEQQPRLSRVQRTYLLGIHGWRLHDPGNVDAVGTGRCRSPVGPPPPP